MENLELQVEIMPPIASEKWHCSEDCSSGTSLVSSHIPLRSTVNHLSQGAADV